MSVVEPTWAAFVGPTLPTPRAMMMAMVSEVAAKHGIAAKDIFSDRRAVKLCRARHECFWRMREETILSFPQIGRFFHRDHSTIMSGCKKHARRMAEAAAA